MSRLNNGLKFGARMSAVLALVGALSATAASAQTCLNVAVNGDWTAAFNANNGQGGYNCDQPNPGPECGVLFAMQACCAGATSEGGAGQIQCAVDICNANTVVISGITSASLSCG